MQYHILYSLSFLYFSTQLFLFFIFYLENCSGNSMADQEQIRLYQTRLDFVVSNFKTDFVRSENVIVVSIFISELILFSCLTLNTLIMIIVISRRFPRSDQQLIEEYHSNTLVSFFGFIRNVCITSSIMHTGNTITYAADITYAYAYVI